MLRATGAAPCPASSSRTTRVIVHCTVYTIITGVFHLPLLFARSPSPAQGYWRGTVPGLLLVMPYCSIQFVVLHKFKSLVAGSTDGNGQLLHVQ